MKYKVGQIVKIVSVRYTTFNKPDGKLTARYINCLGPIYEINSGCWYAQIEFPHQIGNFRMLVVLEEDVIAATDRETFLYYTHGPEVLRNEI